MIEELSKNDRNHQALKGRNWDSIKIVTGKLLWNNHRGRQELYPKPLKRGIEVIK
jgi:hypothetical protein